MIGHPVLGTVGPTGSEVADVEVGSRVGVAGVASTGGVCRHCENGREDLGDRSAFIGCHRDGGRGSPRADVVLALTGAIQITPHRDRAAQVCARSAVERERTHELGATWVGGYEQRSQHRLDAVVTFAPVARISYIDPWWERQLWSVADITPSGP